MKKIIAVVSFVTIFCGVVIYAYMWPFGRSNVTSASLSISKEKVIRRETIKQNKLVKEEVDLTYSTELTQNESINKQEINKVENVKELVTKETATQIISDTHPSIEKELQEEIDINDDITKSNILTNSTEENKKLDFESVNEVEGTISYDVEINGSEETTSFGSDGDFDSMYILEEIEYMRSDGQNDVVVDVIYKNPFVEEEMSNDFWIFEVLMNTHSYNIKEKELDEKLIIKSNVGTIESFDVIWLPEGEAEGHHVTGKLLIPKVEDTSLTNEFNEQYLEIDMTGVAGVPRRIFRWTKDELNNDISK